MKTIIQSYIEDTHQYKLLSKVEEIELSSIIKTSKSIKKKQEARERLINCNRRLVIKIAYRYDKFFDIPIMDIVNTGNEGLIKAVDTYNPEKYNTRFSTYAYTWIRHYIYKTLHVFSNTVSIPNHIIGKANCYKEMASQRDDITDKEFMEALNVTKRGLRNLRMAETKTIMLDKEISMGGESESSCTLLSIIADPNQISADKIVANNDDAEYMKDAIIALKPLDRNIIVDLFYNGKTLKQVGKQYGFTAEGIRQRKQKTLNGLKLKLEKQMIFKD